MRRLLWGRALLSCVGAAALCTTSGCQLRDVFANAPNLAHMQVPIPMSPFVQDTYEDHLWEKERYNRTPILPPIEGEFAPVFCQDPPSNDEVMRAMPSIEGNIPFLLEKQRNNVRIVAEPLGDWVDEPRFYPLVGPAQLHHCHYKVRIYYDGTVRSDWPVPYTHRDEKVEVLYMDHDHLHRVGSAPSDTY